LEHYEVPGIRVFIFVLFGLILLVIVSVRQRNGLLITNFEKLDLLEVLEEGV